MRLGNLLLNENQFQNESIDNHTSAISETTIRPLNVYNKTRENISINSDKKLKVISNSKSKETNI